MDVGRGESRDEGSADGGVGAGDYGGVVGVLDAVAAVVVEDGGVCGQEVWEIGGRGVGEGSVVDYAVEDLWGHEGAYLDGSEY